MRRRPPRTRRALLTAIAASTVGVAGCSFGPGDDDQDETDRNDTDPSTGTESGGSTATATTTPLPELNPSEHIDPAAIEGGGRSQFAEPPDESAVIDTFGRFDDRWSVTAGRAAAQSEAVYHGDQSVLLDSTGDNRVQIDRVFDGFRDLSGLDFSMAVCVQNTSRGAVFPYLTVSDVNGNHRIYSGHVSSLAPNRWVRVDFGVEVDEGVDMTIVDSISVGEFVGNADSQFLVDDLQVRQKADTGVVVLSFEDSHRLDHEFAFPLLEDHGMDGVLFAPAASITDSQEPSLSDFQAMSIAGWDVGAHTMQHERLPNYSREEQRQILEENITFLRANEFDDGRHHFRTTKGAYDTNTLDIVRDLFRTAYVPQGGATGAGVRATDPHTIGFKGGDDYEHARDLVDAAAEYRQFLGLSFHMRNMEDRDAFRGLIDRIATRVRRGDLRVVTPSEYYQEYVEGGG